MLNEKVKHLELILEEILEELSPKDPFTIDQKKIQLEQMLKMITKLQKEDIPIPNEITAFKLKLINDIDWLSNNETVRIQLVYILEKALAHISAGKKLLPKVIAEDYNSRKRSLRTDERILKLIERNHSLFPMDITCKHKCQEHSAIINIDGTFSTIKNGETFISNSLNQLTILSIGSQRDGWSLWKTKLDNKTYFLKDLITNYEV